MQQVSVVPDDPTHGDVELRSTYGWLVREYPVVRASIYRSLEHLHIARLPLPFVTQLHYTHFSMVNQSRGSHNTASANQDDMEYHPQTGGASGNAAYDDNLDYKKEDRETKRSEQSGQIPRSEFRAQPACEQFLICISGEVDDLLSSSTEEERDVSGYTRGVDVDAYKQERDMDRELGQTGVIDDEEAV